MHSTKLNFMAFQFQNYEQLQMKGVFKKQKFIRFSHMQIFILFESCKEKWFQIVSCFYRAMFVCKLMESLQSPEKWNRYCRQV